MKASIASAVLSSFIRPLNALRIYHRVHEYEYLMHLKNKCEEHNRKQDLPYFYASEGMLDSDTPLVAQSFAAAKRFCRFVRLDSVDIDCQHP